MTSAFTTIIEFLQFSIVDQLKRCTPGLDARKLDGADPRPLCAVLDWKGSFHLLFLDNAYFANAETKDNLVIFLRRLVRTYRAQAIGMSMTYWSRTLECPEGTSAEEAAAMRPFNRLSDDPDAREFVMVSAASQFKKEHYRGSLVRHAEQPPELGEWTPLFGGGWELESDRFLDPLQQAIIAVA